MCVPSPIDLAVIDKKSSISFRLKFGKQSEEGSISNYPLPESNYFSQEPKLHVHRCKRNVKTCLQGEVLKIGSPYCPGIAMA